MILAGQFTDWWAYLAAPIAGGVVAVALYDRFLRAGSTPPSDLRPDMTISPRPLSAETAMPGRDWRLLAACRHADPELFFPVSVSGPSLDQLTQAKAICAGCPVRRQCLAFALDTRQDHGVWGGTSEEERRPRAGKRCTRT